MNGLNPTFELHLKAIPHLSLSDTLVGVIFLVGAGFYVLTGPFVGMLSDRYVVNPRITTGVLAESLY